MKENPLFIDSTKVSGDSIKAQFELTQILLHDNETAHLRVLEVRQSQFHDIDLSYNHNSYSTSLYLRHNNIIQFQFVIKKNNIEILKSKIFKQMSCYLIEEPWEPSPESPLLSFVQTPKLNYDTQISSHLRTMEHKASLGGLIKKWGF